MCVCVCVLSHIWLFVTPWTVDLQSSPSMEFSRQEYWNGLPFPTPGHLPNPGIEPASPISPALAGGFFATVKNLYTVKILCHWHHYVPGTVLNSISFQMLQTPSKQILHSRWEIKIKSSVLNLGCIIRSPVDLLKFLVPEPHPPYILF